MWFCMMNNFWSVCSDARGLHSGLWCRTGRAWSWGSFLAHLHRSARLGAAKAPRVPGVPPGDSDWAAGEKQPQRELQQTRNTKCLMCHFFCEFSPQTWCLGFLQGEALETVTTAAVCLFTTQSQLADQVPPLGHLPRIMAALNHKNNAVPKSSIRLLHVLSDNEVRSQICLNVQYVYPF